MLPDSFEVWCSTPTAETGKADQGLLVADGNPEHGCPGCPRGAQLMPYQGTGLASSS